MQAVARKLDDHHMTASTSSGKLPSYLAPASVGGIDSTPLPQLQNIVSTVNLGACMHYIGVTTIYDTQAANSI
jgi:hypothetical protein